MRRHTTTQNITTTLFPVPFSCFSHELDVQVSTGKVVPVRSGLAVEASAEADGHRRPAESPDIRRKDSVQHLHVRQLCFRLGSNTGFWFDAIRNGHTQTAELTRAKVNRYDLQYSIIIILITSLFILMLFTLLPPNRRTLWFLHPNNWKNVM